MLIHGILQIVNYNEEKGRKKRKKREENKHDEIIVDHFNIGKCSYTDGTQGTIEPKSVIELSAIYLPLIEQEKSNSSYIENTPPILCTTSANLLNHSGSSVETKRESREIFSAQDNEFLSMLADLPTSADISRTMEISSEELDQQNTTYENRLAGYLCSWTLFLT